MSGWLRRRVRERLAHLVGGQLTVREDGAVDVFGTSTGPDPLQAAVTVHDVRAYEAVARSGLVGAGEAYGAGWWDADDLAQVVRLFVRNTALLESFERGASRFARWILKWRSRRDRSSREVARGDIAAHYDLGNAFFELFLDETMTYSCGIHAQTDTPLREAQVAKLDAIAHKLGLGPQHHVLEIGCGWGSFAIHAARTYGCRVTATTISDAQASLANQRVQEAGLSDRIDVLSKDFRDLEGTFDRVVSIEMVEAIGHANLGAYLQVLSDRLAPDGLAAIQAITVPDQLYDVIRRRVDFIKRWIFPGSFIPSTTAIMKAMANHGDLRAADLEEIGSHYALTLEAWRKQLDARWDEARALGLDEPFLRRWRYYLAYCEGGYAERRLGNVQLVFAKPGWRGSVPRGEVPRVPREVVRTRPSPARP